MTSLSVNFPDYCFFWSAFFKSLKFRVPERSKSGSKMLLNAEEGIQSFPFLNFTSLPNYEGVFEAGKSDLFKDLLVALNNYVTLRPWGV